ncbi:NOL1/NOP2/sun family protein, putative [Eimeria tenella]|uniref:NOL1/NOP2/sun family protein, putative n=1 Tax=Eimeria tenella TaxID=5802 RepID=U6KX03_EIMTE|nr:NOL1/NOP2/sun family protein, putative [Eimeria tenella]CDJ42481.1 NOL1/NOP2/sun family protein, putative [Eimeria tenella]|eukprot:XP_013233231.1 NOL1/NOP2/sun family protein, putative [Eimeria tenella]
MEETRKSGFFGVRDLLCPEVYNHLQLQCPYCPEAAFSFDSFIDNLLVPAPARSLRVNRIKCTDSSVALAEAEQCIGMKGHVHPQFPDILIFPPKEAPEGSSKRCSALNMDFPDTQELAAEDEVRGNPKKVTEDMGAPCRQNNPVMVVVGPQCGQAVLRGAHVYAPGVLAAEPGSRLGSVVSVWAIPRPSKNTPGCAATCMRSLAFLRGAYLHGERRSEVEKWGVFCGRGTLEQSLKDVFLHSKGLAIRMESACDLSSLPASVVAQQLPSCVAGFVLSPLPGELVLDMCAAPGHKTSHLASLMKNRGVVVAVERSKKRMEEMKAHLASLGASAVECIQGDSAKNKWQCSLGAPTQLKDSFDKVLADVPCTGLGLRPRIVYDDVDMHSVREAARYQREFLAAGCALLKPGGVLVYSTCSISWAENEDNVLWALENLPLTVEPPEPYFPGAQPPQNKIPVQRFCPSGQTIGFFIAKFRKQKEAT